MNNKIERMTKYLQPSLTTYKIEAGNSEIIQNIFYINKNGNIYFVVESIGNDIDRIFYEIEQKILSTKTLDKLSPRDSYLIICWEHEINLETDNLKIVKLEENEYLMKKYVFSYSVEDYDVFFDKYLNSENIIPINNIIADLSKKGTSSNVSVEEKFLVNILAKFPYMEFSFPEKKSLLYLNMVDDSIKNAAISDSNIYEINKILFDFINTNETDKFSKSCSLKNIEEDNNNIVNLLNELLELENNEQ